MRNLPRRLGLCAGFCVASLGAATQAGAAVISTGATQNTAFAVSSTDLLQGVVGTATGNVSSVESKTTSNLSVLTNGTFGPHDAPSFVDAATAQAQSEIVAPRNDAVLTFSLPGSTGYNLSSITAYVGWQDQGRDAVRAIVSYATTNDPLTATFLPITQVDYNPSGTGSGKDNQLIISDNGGANIASNARLLRFVFATDNPGTVGVDEGQENGYSGWREIDVVGTAVPEPASLGILALGGIAMMRRRRS